MIYKMRHLLLAVLGFAFITGCTTKAGNDNTVVRKVKVAKVEQANNIITNKFAATIKPCREVNLVFRVAGPIQNIFVNDGDNVKKGQLIAQIDPRDYQIQLDVSQAEYEKVLSETKRVIELYKRNSATEADYQKAVAGEKMITSKLEHAKNQFNDTKLYAPFDGYIQKINFEPGELINTGMPLTTLTDKNNLQAVVDVPVNVFLQKNNFTDFKCIIPQLNNQSFDVELTSSQAKVSSNQLHRLYFNIKPKNGFTINPGIAANIIINYKTVTDSRIVVPLSAVFNSNGKAYVWVYNAKNSKVSKTEITIGSLATNGRVYINSGLTGNETIIVAGVNAINHNDTVEPLAPLSKTNIGGLL